MGRYSIKGDVESVKPAQLDFISGVLEKRGFESADVLIEPLGQAGDNYMSNVKKIDVTENGQTLNIVAKLAPDSAMMREMGNLAEVFHNEHVIYTELMPKFKQLQMSANVPEEDMLKFAECFGSNTDAPHELILLENLNPKNYAMMDRFQPLPNECVQTALKQLAIYHSLSYVLKNREPDTFTAISAKLVDVFTKAMPGPMEEQAKMFFNQMRDSAIKLLTEEKHKEALARTGDILQHAAKLSVDVGSKHSVIQQGDGWTNNILFKLEDGNPVPGNCVLIDYQNARETSPAYDIMYMLFNSTSYEQRLKHYYEFIDYYHSVLDNSLNYFGLKVSLLYPRDKLDADLKRYGKFVLSTCVLVSNFILRKVDEASKVHEAMKNTAVDKPEDVLNAMIVTDQESVGLFKAKVEGLVDSFLEFGLI